MGFLERKEYKVLSRSLSSSIDSLSDQIKFIVASWVLLYPSFLPSCSPLPPDLILLNWKKVAFSQCGLLLSLLKFA